MIKTALYIVIISCCFQTALAEIPARYFYYVNSAEKYIITNEYKLAMNSYDSAFEIWQRPFAVDLFNAMKCGSFDSDNVYIKKIAVRLIRLGCESSFFQSPDYLASFRASTEWRDLINEYMALRMNYISHNNFKLRTKIEQLNLKDKMLRNIDHNYTFLKDSIYKVDDTVKYELLKLFKNKFPNEYDYGIFLKDDTTLLNYEPLHLIILHNYSDFDTAVIKSANVKNYNFTDILLKEVKLGNMHPQEFAYLNDRSGRYKVDNTGYSQEGIVTKIKDKYYFAKHTLASDEKIDKKRSSIYLDKINEERSKTIYCIKNENIFILFRHMGYVINYKGFMFTDKQIESWFMEAKID